MKSVTGQEFCKTLDKNGWICCGFTEATIFTAVCAGSRKQTVENRPAQTSAEAVRIVRGRFVKPVSLILISLPMRHTTAR